MKNNLRNSAANTPDFSITNLYDRDINNFQIGNVNGAFAPHS